jgi:hypothetical protein
MLPTMTFATLTVRNMADSLQFDKEGGDVSAIRASPNSISSRAASGLYILRMTKTESVLQLQHSRRTATKERRRLEEVEQ